jgi:glycosyltransferase involved in cell wall biosynthesis
MFILKESLLLSKKKYNNQLLVVGITSKYIITGLSVALETFLGGLKAQSVKYILVDLSIGMSSKRASVFSLYRLACVILVLFKVLWNLRKVNIVYVTMASSRLGFLRDLSIILMAKTFKRKLVFHLHGGGYIDFYTHSSPFLKFIIRHSLYQVDKIIVLGQLLKHQFTFLSPKNRPCIIVIPNGLPYEPSNKVRKKSISKNKPIRLLYLSNMIPSKGYMDVLEACKILKNKKIDFICEFAGSFISTGSSLDSLEPTLAKEIFFETIRKEKLSSQVKYHGVAVGKDKHNLFSNANIFLLPTFYHGEGQPISIIEALSYGLPVISTRFRGIPEQITNNKNGILLKIINAKNITNGIEKIISSSSNYENMSIEAYKRYKTRFTKEQYLNRLIPAVLNF